MQRSGLAVDALPPPEDFFDQSEEIVHNYERDMALFRRFRKHSGLTRVHSESALASSADSRLALRSTPNAALHPTGAMSGAMSDGG